MTDKKLCGAKTRKGSPCARPGMKNGRCKLHGGMSTGAPKGTQNALKHGLYSRVFSDAQLDEAVAMEGDVSRELAIARLQLANCIKQRQLQEDTPQLDEIKDETLAAEEDEEVIKKARAKDAAMCGEYYDPNEDDFTNHQESEPLKRTRTYKRRDWAAEENRLLNTIAKLEMQLVRQKISVVELEQRKKDLEMGAKSNSAAGADVEDMTDDELDDYLKELLNEKR